MPKHQHKLLQIFKKYRREKGPVLIALLSTKDQFAEYSWRILTNSNVMNAIVVWTVKMKPLSFFFLGEKLYLIAFIRLSIKSFFVTMWTLKLLVLLREELHGKALKHPGKRQDKL